jgi:ketosteroid isomerase-like protein
MGIGSDLWDQLNALSSKNDWAGVGSLFATDAVHIDPVGRQEGREVIVAYLQKSYDAFSDITTTTTLLIEQGDIVVVEWTTRSTHTGPIAMPDGTEIAPTGKTVEDAGVTIARVRDGKFLSSRDYFDLMTGMSQLGLLPST